MENVSWDIGWLLEQQTVQAVHAGAETVSMECIIPEKPGFSPSKYKQI